MRKRAAIISFLLFFTAIIPRVWDIGEGSITSDESRWVTEGTDYVRKFFTGRFQESTELFWEHPGIPAAILIGTSCIIKHTILQEDWEYTNMWNERENNLYLQRYIGVARLPIALLGAITCLSLYSWGRYLWGEQAGILAALFLALSPFHIALSRVAHQDVALTCFITLALLSYIVAEEKNRRMLKITSGIFTGLGFLTKITGFFAIPVIILFYRIFKFFRQQSLKYHFSFPLIRLSDITWIMVALAIFTIFYPNVWGNPLRGLINHFAANLKVAADQSLYYFRGEITHNAPGYHYLITTFIRMVPLAIICFFFGITGIIQSLIRKKENTELYLTLIIWIFIIAGLMSFAEKKGDRYVLSIWPALMVVSGLGLEWLGENLRRTLLSRVGARFIEPGFSGRIHPTPTEKGSLYGTKLTCSLVSIIIVSNLVPVTKYCPNYYLYVNTWAGGPANAKNLMLFTWGEGHKEAMEYILNQAGPGKRVMICGYEPNAQYYYPGVVDYFSENAEEYDYLVVVINKLQRLNPEHWIVKYTHTYEPEHVVRLQGVDVAWVYNLREKKENTRVVVEQVLLDKEEYLIGEPIRINVRLNNTNKLQSKEIIINWRLNGIRNQQESKHRIRLLPGEKKTVHLDGFLPQYTGEDLNILLYLPEEYLPHHPDCYSVPINIQGYVKIKTIKLEQKQFTPGQELRVWVLLQNHDSIASHQARAKWLLSYTSVKNLEKKEITSSKWSNLKLLPDEERIIGLIADTPKKPGLYQLIIQVEIATNQGYTLSEKKQYAEMIIVK